MWLFALACGAAGVYGLADLGTAGPVGKLLLVGPHAAGGALAAGGGRQRTAAGLVAVAGSAAMAGLSWVDALDRQTEGREWRFNNALSGAMYCVANWFVLVFVGCVVLVLSAPAKAVVVPSGAGEEGVAPNPERT
ncbi:hypothetical protein R5W23_005641 [Gemmata sp. JC673]|uniref:Uncharacterized protein n=1 Tax=Gemmata algarum TaxID=2975278 RepID=A0ABU5EXV4_9BACT|nr:hypothetical protein [Gemmata algarum]MDY3558521.1 hypothetical protein [Gemmata algarum]